jgi:hypothetical protein
MGMRRKVVWLQLILGWLPVGVLYGTLIASSHPGAAVHFVIFAGALSIGLAAPLSIPVQRLTERVAWPHPFRVRFALAHIGLAIAYALAWQGVTRVAQWAWGLVLELHGPGAAANVFTFRLVPSLVLGVWLYVMVAGVAYATRATERAARAESIATRSQLAALRAQLHPHFLFNALHTVVQLIPIEPARAAAAAEQLGQLLRRAVEETRDLVPLAEEVEFVERYLELERIRFGDRLRVRIEVRDGAAAAAVPAFAVQTLVENAVRHGAAPRVEPTDIVLQARLSGAELTIVVGDTGAGATPAQLTQTDGTGLKRLRERLAVLYGTRARLEAAAGTGGGFAATLVLPPS